jgi:hypothetical protein
MTPMGPKGQKRPRDANQLAKLIVDIATGQIEDRESTPEEQGKSAAAMKRGHIGGLIGGRSRAEKLPSDVRVSIAKKAARTRWNKKKS